MKARCSHIMQSCGGCRFTRYCSVACQRADWRQHKPVCLGIRESSYNHRVRRGLGVYYGMMPMRQHIQWRVDFYQLEHLYSDLNVGRVIGNLTLDRHGNPASYDEGDVEPPITFTVVQRPRRTLNVSVREAPASGSGSWIIITYYVYDNYYFLCLWQLLARWVISWILQDICLSAILQLHIAERFFEYCRTYVCPHLIREEILQCNDAVKNGAWSLHNP